MQDGLICLVTDPVTNETFVRGAAGRFQAIIRDLEQQLSLQRSFLESRVSELEKALQEQKDIYHHDVGKLTCDNGRLMTINEQLMREFQACQASGRSQPPSGNAMVGLDR